MKFEVLGKFDVIVIGSGISGLTCALELSKHKKSVCIVTKEAITESSSLYAQGGIAVPLGNYDSFEKHFNDTLKAGSGLCDTKVAKEIINFSTKAFEKLVDCGVGFDTGSQNIIHQTREAVHSVARVCHVGGDASGRFITKTLIDKACREPNISISQGAVVLSILNDDNGNAFGVLIEDVTRNKYILCAKDIIIASGGAGQLFMDTTNPLVCTGDGLAMAYQLGAILQDIEMIQFHPTVLLDYGDPFLITEAIRGEGGKLKNIKGEYFASKYHEQAELAPRDVLARAILNEISVTNSKFVFLDVSNFNIEYFKNRFPTVHQSCIERRVNLFKTGIPVRPAAHYFIGGIKCNISGKSDIPSLWVVGEAASNGFHGANRLASNSLLECIVVPHFLVNEILSTKSPTSLLKSKNYLDVEFEREVYDESKIRSITTEIKIRNLSSLGLIRDEFTLSEHFNWLRSLEERLNINVSGPNVQAQELKNMILLSQIICQAAILRKNSLGVHYRKDFPDNPKEMKHSISRRNVQILKPVSIFE